MSEVAEWVLPLVVRIERDDPPARTAALEAGACAVLRMLTSDEPEWQDAVAAWDGSRIRKVVRRARGSGWRRVRSLPGLDVERDGARVRVFPPVPVDAWPPDLARLQVGGTELADPEPPGPPLPGRPLILLAPGLGMSAGKAMAQAGHAAQLGWRAAGPATRARWRDDGFATDVRTASPHQWQELLESGVPVVADAGFTEVEPGSRTALIQLPD